MSSGSSSDVALSAAAHIRTLNRSETLGSVGSAAPSSSGWSSFDGLSGAGSSTWGTQSAGFGDPAKASHCENAPFSAAFPSNRAFPSSNAGGAPVTSNAPHVAAGGTINASTSTTTSGSSTSTAAGSVISSSAPRPAGDGARTFVNGTGVPAASSNAPLGQTIHAGPMSALTPQQIALLQQQQQRGLLLQQQQQQQLLQGLDQSMNTHHHSYGNAQAAHSQSQTPFRQQFMQQHQAYLPQSSNAYPSIPSTTNQQSQAALIIQQALMAGAAANAGNAYPQTSNAALLSALLAQQQQNNNKTNAHMPQQFGPRPGAQSNANPLAGHNLNGISPALAAALLQSGQMSSNVNAPNSLHHLSGGYPHGQRLAQNQLTQNQLQSEALIAMQRQHSGGGGLSSSSGALPHLGSGAVVGSQQQQQQQMSQQQLQAIAQLSMLQNNQASGMNANMSANANAKGNYSSGTTMGNLGGIGQLPAHQQVALLNAMQNLNGGNLDNAAQYMNGMKNAVAGQRNGNPFPGRVNPPRPAGPTSSSSSLGRIPSNGMMAGNNLQHQMTGNLNVYGQNQSQQPGGSNGTAAIRNSTGGMVLGPAVPPPLPPYSAAQTSESASVQGITRVGPGIQAMAGETSAIDPVQTLREIGRTLAQLGITVEAAVNAGLLGGLSASDVRIVTDAHRVAAAASGGAAQGKMLGQAPAMGYIGTADGGNVSRTDSRGNSISLNRKTDQGATPVVHHHMSFEDYPGSRYGMRRDHFAVDDAHRNQGTNSAPNPSSPTGSIGGMSAMSAPVANHKSSNEYRSLEMMKERYGRSERTFDDAASSIQSALDARDEVDALLSEIDAESYQKIKHVDEMVLHAKMKESSPTFDATQYGFFDAQSNGSREGLLEAPLNGASNSSDALSTADDVIENRPNKLSLKVLSSSQSDLEKMHDGREMTEEASASTWDSLKDIQGVKEGQEASAGRTRDCIGNWIAGLSLGTGF